MSAFDTQVGGDHYKKLAIQPMEYSMANNLDALQHTIIKYVTRFRDKNGIQDLGKAKHCLEMLIQHEKNKLGEEEPVSGSICENTPEKVRMLSKEELAEMIRSFSEKDNTQEAFDAYLTRFVR